MNKIDQVYIQWDCQQLLNRVLLHMDNADWVSLAGCYTIDAELARPTDPHNSIKGRSDILASFHARPEKTTCHLLANSIFTIVNEHTVNANSRALLMTGPSVTDSDVFPVEANHGLLVGTFRDTLARVDDQWLISKRIGSIELKYQ